MQNRALNIDLLNTVTVNVVHKCYCTILHVCILRLFLTVTCFCAFIPKENKYKPHNII